LFGALPAGGRFHSRLKSLLHGADDAEKLRDSSS
jgi:hypothetical protein